MSELHAHDLGIAGVYADWLIRNGDTGDIANGEIIRRVLADHARLAGAVADVGALCDAADEAALRPSSPGFEPHEVPWTVALRVICAPVPLVEDPK